MVKIEGLYKAAYEAHRNTSFSPDKRAERIVLESEKELSEDLEAIPEHYRSEYERKYKEHLFSWLGSRSRCISAMITGPSNFPTRRAEKASDAERKKLEAFYDWREKTLKRLKSINEPVITKEALDAEEWSRIKADIESSLKWILDGKGTKSLFVSSITKKIETIAKSVDTEMVKKCLDLIRHWNEKAAKPIITAKHSVWKLEEIVEASREAIEDKKNTESKEDTINGVRVVRNFQADRIQMFFDGKPSYEMITKLKKNAFKWSPSNGCWQRKLTLNAIFSAQKILK